MQTPLGATTKRLIVVGCILALIAAGGSVAFARMMAPPPPSLDLSAEHATANNQFIVSYTP